MTLDQTFGALSNATRRGILEHLAEGESNVGALVASYGMSQPAISKHLRVLERASLVVRTRRGRESIVRANPEMVAEAEDWIARYTQIWTQKFDAVDAHLDREKPDR